MPLVLTDEQLAAILDQGETCGCGFHDDSCDPLRENAGTDYCCEDCPFWASDSPSAGNRGHSGA